MTETPSERTDRLLQRYVLKLFREDCDNRHFRECTDIVLIDYEATDGSYGCDTGCSYVRFEADVTCPHGFSEHWESGDFGRLSDVIKELIEEDDKSGD